MLSVMKKPGRIGLARYEVPHAIFQAVMAYSEDDSLDEYDGFVICLDGMDMSKRFNILEQDGRRGLLKLLMGLFHYLAQSPQSKIIQHHIGYS
ncbi:hypothetical protein PVAR5_3418 [Paecilomyces variotii No. 5]|uniref:Uncharacterized protein n=1 Tax=Byssochlamys spectabilis (strain No. 5 / NBRC 109023) TaxID=1356009 RepID=V5FCN5_BYSSN|nr:hypothetical protein PVAR5_3418 [Paecilomyces variotii No. 5]